jgi:hypothetical protein
VGLLILHSSRPSCFPLCKDPCGKWSVGESWLRNKSWGLIWLLSLWSNIENTGFMCNKWQHIKSFVQVSGKSDFQKVFGEVGFRETSFMWNVCPKNMAAKTSLLYFLYVQKWPKFYFFLHVSTIFVMNTFVHGILHIPFFKNCLLLFKNFDFLLHCFKVFLLVVACSQCFVWWFYPNDYL